jgi:hypothetical protein
MPRTVIETSVEFPNPIRIVERDDGFYDIGSLQLASDGDGSGYEFIVKHHCVDENVVFNYLNNVLYNEQYLRQKAVLKAKAYEEAKVPSTLERASIQPCLDRKPSVIHVAETREVSQ